MASTILDDGSLDKEITARIKKANQSLGMLQFKVPLEQSLSISIKLKLFYAFVV